MDILSRLLSGIHARSPLVARMNVGEPASIDMLEGVGLPFHYIVRGRATLELGGARHPLEAGDLAFLPHATRHVIHFEGGGDVRSILEVVAERNLPAWLSDVVETPLLFDIGPSPFAASVLSGTFLVDLEETALLLRSLPDFIKLGSRGTSLQSVADAVWGLVLHEVDAAAAGFSAVASRALELMVVQALRGYVLQAEHPPGWARGIGHGNVRRALQAIYADPGRDWTLAALASVAGQSRSSFATAFRATMDETPFSHLRRLRIHLAAARLQHSPASLASIAVELGYANSYALSRAFRNEMGISGAGYRRRERTIEGAR